MKRILWWLALVVLFAGGLTAFVMIPVVADLTEARSILRSSTTDIDRDQILEARQHVTEATERLDSLAGSVVKWIPVVGTNARAVEDVALSLPPVLGSGLELERLTSKVREKGLVSKGRIELEPLRGLMRPLQSQIRALRHLREVARARRTGAILPPLWDELVDLDERATELERSAQNAMGLVESSPGLLGYRRPRTYLFLLLNNAELRGAGGILAGVGTLEVDRGRMSLGRLASVHDLSIGPLRTVPAPPVYERRFGHYKANTTLWLNTTFSPDVPDVSLVASRLFEEVTGTATDGAIAIDPRGLAALTPDDAAFELPGLPGKVTSENLARAVYSDAYEAFEDQEQRRDAILALGTKAFDAILENGISGGDTLDRAGDAVAGGHLSFVSFDGAEAQALAAIGASRDLPAVPKDSLLVTVQNFGGGRSEGSKLDYWARRTTEHACDVENDGRAICATTVSLNNMTPAGLTTYVAGTPYGLLRSYLEIYVPRNARLQEVRVDGKNAEFRPETHGDRTAIAVYLEIPRGKERQASVVYELDGVGDGYELVATPQPLATDAKVRIAIGVPDEWTSDGDGEMDEGVIRVSGRLDRTIRISARPEEKRGLSRMWDVLADFWNEPLL